MIQYGFDDLHGGSVLVSASRPGPKAAFMGCDNEELVSLNTLEGRLIRFVSPDGKDGRDCLITGSFDGPRFSRYTTVGNNPARAPPRLTNSRSATGLRINRTGPGALQGSADRVLPGKICPWADDGVLFSSSQRVIRVRRR